MNANNIITLPHPSLRKRSQRIRVITNEVLQLAENMKLATLDWEQHRQHEVGVALAAVQVNQLQRIVIIRDDFDDKNNKKFNTLINPEITKYFGDKITDYEGCLSVKNIYGKVPRSEKVKVKALNIKGDEIRITAEGFLARLLQHEIDHTNGITYIDRIGLSGEVFTIKDDGGMSPLHGEAKHGELQKLEIEHE